MDVWFVTIVMFGAVFAGVFLGYPIAFVMGGVAVIAASSMWGLQALPLMAYKILNIWSDPILIALPLFFLLAGLLQRSGIADELYDVVYRWMGGLRGGLAIGTIGVGTVMGAISGVAAADVIAMGMIALPSMFRHNYKKNIVLGSIVAGGTLGPLIPPSVIMILYAFVAEVSVGQLWFASFLPGLLWAVLFAAYIAVRCYLNPQLGPPVPPEKRASFGEKLASLRGVIAPILVIFLVLGTIYLGISTPTEAAVIGCLGMIIAIGFRRKLNWPVFRDSLYPAFKLSALSFWLILGVSSFNSVYVGMGGRQLMEQFVLGLQVGPFVVVLAMMLVLLIMGTMMDITAIVLICTPVFIPIIKGLGLDPIWFGVLFIMCSCMGLMSPPYGFSLFMMRTVVPKGVTMMDIYVSVIPFWICMIVGILIVAFFPPMATWLPGLIIQ